MSQLSELRLNSIRKTFNRLGIRQIDPKKINTPSFKRVFREKMYFTIVESLANHPTLNQKIVIKGGGALLLAYNSKRRTDDIDFAIIPQKKEPSLLLKELKKEFLSLKPKIEKAMLKPTLKASDSFGFRISYSIYFDESFKPAIQLEGRYEPILLKPTKLNVGLFGSLLIQHPKEILTEKIVALFTRYDKRKTIKTTDIFDIYYLANFFGLDLNKEIFEERLKHDFHNPPKIDEWAKYKSFIISLIENSKEALSTQLKKQLDKNYFEVLNIQKIIQETKDYLLDLFSKIGV